MSSLQSISGASVTVTSQDVPETHIAAVDWAVVESALGCDGYAVLTSLLTPRQCDEVSGYFSQDARFRSRIVMERHAFGRGEYKYFSYPLPELVGRLRNSLYPPLAPIANRWHAAMHIDERFPATHADCGARQKESGVARQDEPSRVTG